MQCDRTGAGSGVRYRADAVEIVDGDLQLSLPKKPQKTTWFIDLPCALSTILYMLDCPISAYAKGLRVAISAPLITARSSLCCFTHSRGGSYRLHARHHSADALIPGLPSQGKVYGGNQPVVGHSIMEQ